MIAIRRLGQGRGRKAQSARQSVAARAAAEAAMLRRADRNRTEAAVRWTEIGGR